MAAADLLTAARAGEDAAFAGLVEHTGGSCGSLLPHAGLARGRRGPAAGDVPAGLAPPRRLRGRSTLRAWLYRIATNACLGALVRPAGSYPRTWAAPAPTWTSRPHRRGLAQPFPDQLLEPAGAVVARETIELAFLAALQHLPPAQRAVLILRDVVGWPAKQAAEQLGLSVAAANSNLHPAPGRSARPAAGGPVRLAAAGPAE